MRWPFAFLLPVAALGAAGSAKAAPTALYSCSTMGMPALQTEFPGSASILLDPDGRMRIRVPAEPMGNQQIGAIVSGNGLVVEDDGSKVDVSWVCLLESDERPLFFHWSRTSPPRPTAACRDAADRTTCLRGLVALAEQALTDMHARIAPLPLETPFPLPRTATPIPFLPPADTPKQVPPVPASDAAWRAYRDGECDRQADIDPASPIDTRLECVVVLTHARIAQLGEP